MAENVLNKGSELGVVGISSLPVNSFFKSLVNSVRQLQPEMMISSVSRREVLLALSHSRTVSSRPVSSS
jgi:hypothetical protein